MRYVGGLRGLAALFLFSTHFFTFVATITSGSLFTSRSLKAKKC